MTNAEPPPQVERAEPLTDPRLTAEEAERAVVQAEIDAFLQDDNTVLGDVFRWDKEGLSPREMADRAGTQLPNFVYNYRQQLAALRDGVVPAGATIAGQTAGRARKWLKFRTWSDPARRYLEELRTRLEAVASDAVSVEREEEAAAEKTAEALKEGLPGVYVYSLPHYLRYPYDADSGRTLLKVGHSAVDVFSRVGGQTRTTALPEDPVLLRIYMSEQQDTRVDEQYFHRWLEAADHGRSRSTRGGSEWFLTSTKFLDRIASERGLNVRSVLDLDVGDA